MANNEDMCRVMNEVSVDYEARCAKLEIMLRAKEDECDALRGTIKRLLDAYDARCDR